MSEWQEVELSSICDIYDGPHATPPKQNDGCVFLGISSLGYDGRIDSSQFEYISEEFFQKWTKRIEPRHKDIVFSYETKLGVAAMIPRNFKCCLGRRMGLLRPKKNIEPKFLLYAYLAPEFQKTIHERTFHGSTVDRIPLKDIGCFPISIPSLAEQKAIATVLSSLDDKIDLLHRQNKTLEAMAETLFRQWFIEEAQEDWEEVSLEDVTDRITDGAHVSPPNVELGRPMASVKDMYQWGINIDSCRHISTEDFDYLVKADCRPLKNDILIAKDGSYLKHVFVVEDDLDVVILSSIAILRQNGKYHPFLLATFLKLESTRESLENIVTGAVIPRIVLKDFRKYRLLLPPKPLQDQALVFIKPIYENCWKNNRQIQTLENLRDTLLPKLMSGEVRVKTSI